MPYQLSTQSVKKNCETPVHVAGIAGVTRGGALVTRLTSAASAPFGPNITPAANIATAIPLFFIKRVSPQETRPHTCHRRAFSCAHAIAIICADLPDLLSAQRVKLWRGEFCVTRSRRNDVVP